MDRIYDEEKEGQRLFYESYIRLVDSSLTMEDIVTDYNDGVLRGNLIEFKKDINDLSTVLFQAIKYLSARRIKGKPVPANILLISLNTGKAYCYKSIDYIEDIEKVYMGSASKFNLGFQSKPGHEVLDYITSDLDEKKLIDHLRSDEYTKINIDENNIVGWAKHYYEVVPRARKSDFIGDLTGKVKLVGEIRRPNVFKDYIHPYKYETNVKFQYLMDRLNDEILKKNLGAFYTPQIYADKSLELLREAIARVPEGNDYIILDRCAGTGNLVKGLTEEELSHVILSTIEYYEYKVLLEVLGDKVRHIVPPTEREDTFNMGLVRGANALSKEYIEHDVIQNYLEDPKVTVILFENPPYAETTSIEHQKQKKSKQSSSWKQSYVVKEMAKEVKGAGINDLGNAFIWSAFKYYLRQPTDSYIVYSPVKYWKTHHIVNRKFISGFAFNRRHFHTKINACVMVALWSNEEDHKTEGIKIDAYDVVDNELVHEGELDVKRVFNTYSQKYYDKRKFEEDTEDGIWTGLNGLEAKEEVKKRIKPLYNENIVGYIVADSSGFDNPDTHSSLLVAGRYNGNGFFLREDNYLEKLPMFAASRYITYNRGWTERARVMKSSDKEKEYVKDVKKGKLYQYLLKTLLFTTLETQNHMRSFEASNGKYYRNEICLDDTTGDTLATRDIKHLEVGEKEERLLRQWELVLTTAKTTENYNKELTYGVYQIIDELNTYTVVENGRSKKRIYDYPDLNGHLSTLKELVRNYYNEEIVPTLFEYEFLK